MARRRSYAPRGQGQGPALPGLEDSLLPSREIRTSPDRNPPPRPPAAIDARAILALCKLGHGELLPLLALVVLRSSEGSWRATQAQAARALGVTVRTLHRHERAALALGVLEIEGQGAERRARVIHEVIHKLCTPDTRDRSNRTSVSGDSQAIGFARTRRPELLSSVPSYLHVRARARANPGPARTMPAALVPLVELAELWPNVLPQVRELGRELEEAWGVEAFARYCSNLAPHLERFAQGRRGGLLLGSLRTRAFEVRNKATGS